jgi:C-terminal processing protease CtpA/Prc
MPTRVLAARAFATLLGISLGVGCQGKTPSTPTAPTATATPSAAVTTYLNSIIDLARNNSINRLTIDWTAYRSAVLAEAGGAQTIAELMPAIRVAITLLRDGHSSYRSALGTTIFVSLRSCSAPAPVTLSLPASIATIAVGAFSGTTEQANAYARQIQDTIASRDRDDLVGWIVDLRSNGGGNMWPMIAGLGPILGEGPLGYFISPVGTETIWEYRNGSSFSGTFAVSTVSPPYTLKRQAPRVAVLSDNRIASSGEATLIAFIRRPDTRSFGQPTCGLSTANATYPLSDGATLTLTTSLMADRAKTPFGDSIPPDELIDDPNRTIQRAVEWIQTGR